MRAPQLSVTSTVRSGFFPPYDFCCATKFSEVNVPGSNSISSQPIWEILALDTSLREPKRAREREGKRGRCTTTGAPIDVSRSALTLLSGRVLTGAPPHPPCFQISLPFNPSLSSAALMSFNDVAHTPWIRRFSAERRSPSVRF